MSAFFELLVDEDQSEIMDMLKEKLDNKMQEILDTETSEYVEDGTPLYTSEGNIIRINRFTKTKGTC
jgi:hypothetical protein